MEDFRSIFDHTGAKQAGFHIENIAVSPSSGKVG